MELTISLQEHLDRLSVLHPTLCPRQVLGARMARLACMLLGVDPAIERKALFVYMEVGRCAADAVTIVTTASATNGLMRLMDYGKVAATVVNPHTDEAVRVSERKDSRETAVAMMPKHLTAWEAQRDAYQIMPDEQLLQWQNVRLNRALPTIAEKHTVICETCGDRVSEHREVVMVGRTLCRSCAFGAYYQFDESEFQLLTIRNLYDLATC